MLKTKQRPESTDLGFGYCKFVRKRKHIALKTL